jgi:hypothetical protein
MLRHRGMFFVSICYGDWLDFASLFLPPGPNSALFQQLKVWRDRYDADEQRQLFGRPRMNHLRNPTLEIMEVY